MMKLRLLAVLFVVSSISLPGYSESVFGTNGVGLFSPKSDGQALSMGILGIGYADTAAVGSINPAAWASISLSRISSGVEITRFASRDNDNTDLSDQFMLPYAAIGVSLKTGYTLGFRFSPFTRMDTRYIQSSYLESDPSYKYEEIYLIKGGISLGSVILAGRLSEKLWIGGSADLIFGNILTLWRLNFQQGGSSSGTYSSGDSFDNEFRFNRKMLGVRPSLGIYYNPSESYSAGIFAAPAVDVNVDEDTEYWGSDSVVTVEKEMQFPAMFGFGAKFPINWKFNGVFDFLWTGWKGKEQVMGNPDNYQESQFLAFGIETRPVADPLAPLIQRMTYRAGINLQNLYYEVPDGETVNEYSFNLGAGIPIKRGYGRLDISLGIGKRGDLSTNDADEIFYRMGIYMTTGEKWFLRKKRY